MVDNRLEILMKKLAFAVGGDPKYYLAFHKWSVENQEKFYSEALNDVGFHWLHAPTMMLDYDPADPMWKARWFLDGEANVYDVCIEEQIRRGGGSELALAWKREDGKKLLMTFSEVKENVELIAARLKADDISKGDAVAVIMPSSYFAYLIFYALQKIGAVFVPIPTEVVGESLIKRLTMTKPKIIFFVDKFITNGKTVSEAMNIDDAVRAMHDAPLPKMIVIPYLGDEGAASNPNLLEYSQWLNEKPAKTVQTEPLSSDDVTMMLFTSGTTGTPKCTMHTYCAMIEDVIENAYSANMNAGDRSFWYTSPGWMMFPWLLMGSNGLGAAAILYDGSPVAEGNGTLLALAHEFQITHLGISPPLIVDLLQALNEGKNYEGRLPSLREIKYTSAPLAANLGNALSKFGYPPNGICGGTDGCFAYCSANPMTKRMDCTTLPTLGIDVHVEVNEKGIWRGSKPDEIGEIVIKHPFPSMTHGLLNDDKERSRFRSVYFNFDPNGSKERGGESKYWFHGDLASIDKNGRLTVHGRADDLLVVHGNKLSPLDVQDAVLRYNPQIMDAASVSISLRGGDGGELIIFAVLKQDQIYDASELENKIKASVKEHVNKLAKPYAVFFIKSIPYTINNKPALRLIRDALENKKTGDVSTIKNTESIDEIIKIGKSLHGIAKK